MTRFVDPNTGGFGSTDNPDVSNPWKAARYQDYLNNRGEFAGMNPTAVPALAPSPAPTTSTATALPMSTITPYVPTGQAYTPSNFSFPDTSSVPLSTNPSVNLTSTLPGVTPLTFDYNAETRTAYESLKPFYDKLLSFAGGDLDLAKRVLKYTYDSGMRQATAEHGQATEEEGIRKYQETTQKMTDQNRRGIIESGFGATERKQMNRSQQLRQEAIDRSLKERESTLTTDKGFGTEREERQLGKTSFDLERQRRNEATTMAQQKYGVKSDIFQNQLSQAQQAENRRIQKEQSNATSGGGGTPQQNTGGTRYTGEQVRAMGMNPDTMISRDGGYYF